MCTLEYSCSRYKRGGGGTFGGEGEKVADGWRLGFLAGGHAWSSGPPVASEQFADGAGRGRVADGAGRQGRGRSRSRSGGGRSRSPRSRTEQVAKVADGADGAGRQEEGRRRSPTRSGGG
jgi:hypothetical protein